MTYDRLQIARGVFAAFGSGDREVVENAFAPDLTFFSPPDPGLDRAGVFERCWPHAGQLKSIEFVRLFEVGDEVVVTYEAERKTGERLRNTEILTFREDKVVKIEVYFGWSLD